MPHRDAPTRLFLDLLEPREVPAATTLAEPFRITTTNGLPAGWAQWSSDTSPAFRVDTTATGDGDLGLLATTARSTTTARAWSTTAFEADVQVSGSVRLSSLVPVELITRGRNLGTAAPSYYAVSVVRGAEVRLLRVVDGKTTTLASVKTADYVSNLWVRVSLRTEGDRLNVTLQRTDTNQYLRSDGSWGSSSTSAIQTTDGGLRLGGQVGFGRVANAADKVALDKLDVRPITATTSPVVEERFTSGPKSGLPDGWAGRTQSGQSFRLASDDTLRQDGTSAGWARAWVTTTSGKDIQASTSLMVDSLIPAGVFVRGSGQTGDSASYYAVTVVRGLEVKLWRVVGGKPVPLATVKSSTWVSGQWIQLSLSAEGSTLRVQVLRADTGQYLSANGAWVTGATWALTRSDTAITTAGVAGIVRNAGYAGELRFDNFILSAPTANGPIPTEQDKPTTPTPPQDSGGTPIPTSPPVTSVPGSPTTNPSLPNVPRTYDWIRVANLAYHGTPLGPYEQSLLRAGVDLVIPNLQYLDDIAKINSKTPQFVYTNLSNLYLGLLTDWNEYADRNRINRESAFYHVTRETVFNGSSPSSIPVNRFWGVYRGSDAAGWTDFTRQARDTSSNVPFAVLGQSVTFGYLEKFRELNVNLLTAALGGWRGTIEYVAAVDASGRPTLWKTLTIGSDGTIGFTRGGQITFDPPKDWVAASVSGSARFFYLRVRTTSAGIAPVARTVLGRNYTLGGKIPAFDYAADKDGDGYLNNAEFAARRAGFNARFAYEGRLFYPYYGEHRYATNVSSPQFRAWAVDYHVRVANTYPLATGFFVDNSIGRLVVDSAGIRERMDGYSADYGSLLGMVNKRLASDGKWLIANTSGGGSTAEPILRNGVSYLEEFGLRPMSANIIQFEDLAATVAYRRELSGGRAYEILDSLPSNGFDATDPRLQIATLAMYYMVADPDLSFLMINGGNEPSSSWNRHWIGAITYDVGRPTGTWSTFAAGSDPANRALDYKVYQRRYENALVLYKPLSYTRGTAGTTADNTATTHVLDGWYRPVNADGSLGKPINRITLRNGEGAILAKV